MDPVVEAFQPVLGLPSWLVQRGYGSFVTLEFGQPQIDVGADVTREGDLPGIPTGVELRPTHVHGEWHLWIYCCLWSLALTGVELSHSESDDQTMGRALRLLDGQGLIDVTVSPDASTDFTFDRGFTLRTWPAPPGAYGDEPVEQWMLFQPSGDVLTLRADGRYARHHETTPQEAYVWIPLHDAR
jgi:hypothetical protein